MKTTFSMMATCLLIAATACNSSSTENVSEETLSDSTELTTGNVKIDNPANFDSSFIEELSKQEATIELKGDKMIFNNESMFIPSPIPTNETINYYATKDGLTYNLALTKRNHTNVDYSFTLKDKSGKLIDSKNGTAILRTSFFLADEILEDDQTEEAYGAVAYDGSTANNWLYVSLGHEKNESNQYIASIQYGNEENGKGFQLEECPTLRSK